MNNWRALWLLIVIFAVVAMFYVAFTLPGQASAVQVSQVYTQISAGMLALIAITLAAWYSSGGDRRS